MSKQNDGERVRSERASTGELHTAEYLPKNGNVELESAWVLGLVNLKSQSVTRAGDE